MPEITDSYRHPVYSWINQQNGPKPEFAWKNVEDLIYHETRFKNKNWQYAPEFCALMEQNWVFNRSMQWIRNGNDNIICYSGVGDLQLTGDHRVSGWFTDPANEVVNNTSRYTQFVKRSTIRARDSVVMPCFQFYLGQHPVADFDIIEADCEWQVCLGIKGRSGVPMFSSGWRKGIGKIRCNIAELYTLKGYTK